MGDKLTDYVTRVKNLDKANRGITLGVAGSVLDGYVDAESDEETVHLVEARLLDSESGPRRGVPDANIPTANVSWWAAKTSHRSSKVDLIWGDVTPARSAGNPPLGKATILLPGMVISGEIRLLTDWLKEMGNAPELQFPAELAVELSAEEKAELQRRTTDQIDEVQLVITEATVVMGHQRIPTTEPSTLAFVLLKRQIMGWTVGLLSFS